MILLTFEPPKIWGWKSHQGFGRRSFSPLYKEREYVQYQIKQQYSGDPVSCAVRISYHFYFIPPTSISKKKRMSMISGETKHIVRGDLTNFCKFWEDTLKEIVIKDDSQVYSMEAEKYYAEKFQVIIKIYPYQPG